MACVAGTIAVCGGSGRPKDGRRRREGASGWARFAVRRACTGSRRVPPQSVLHEREATAPHGRARGGAGSCRAQMAAGVVAPRRYRFRRGTGACRDQRRWAGTGRVRQTTTSTRPTRTTRPPPTSRSRPRRSWQPPRSNHGRPGAPRRCRHAVGSAYRDRRSTPVRTHEPVHRVGLQPPPQPADLTQMAYRKRLLKPQKFGSIEVSERERANPRTGSQNPFTPRRSTS